MTTVHGVVAFPDKELVVVVLPKTTPVKYATAYIPQIPTNTKSPAAATKPRERRGC